MKSFYDLTNLGQARRLRPMALQALRHYPIQVRRIRLVTNDTNGIFRIDTTDGRRFVLRITTPNGCHAREQVQSEMIWLDALRRDTDLHVPKPLRTKIGDLVVTVSTEGVPEPRHCAVFSWVPGVDLEERMTDENLIRYGELSAQLHRHAEKFTPPEGFRIRTLSRVFPYEDPSFEHVEPVVLFGDDYPDLMNPERQKVFRAVADRVQAEIDRLYKNPPGLRVTHNDLHYWNIKVHRGTLYALDFEDLAWGYPIQDIATTFYYIDGDDNDVQKMAKFREGYERHASWPEEYEGQIETLMVGRDVMLANYLLSSDDADDRKMAPRYLSRMQKRLEKYLQEV